MGAHLVESVVNLGPRILRLDEERVRVGGCISVVKVGACEMCNYRLGARLEDSRLTVGVS